MCSCLKSNASIKSISIKSIYIKSISIKSISIKSISIKSISIKSIYIKSIYIKSISIKSISIKSIWRNVLNYSDNNADDAQNKIDWIWNIKKKNCFPQLKCWFVVNIEASEWHWLRTFRSWSTMGPSRLSPRKILRLPTGINNVLENSFAVIL